jgi:hypothetical protein
MAKDDEFDLVITPAVCAADRPDQTTEEQIDESEKHGLDLHEMEAQFYGKAGHEGGALVSVPHNQSMPTAWS